MKILAFESSCDETAVAVVEDGRTVLSDAIASQADLHALYGGVVPEIASRKHVEAIAALTDQALRQAGCEKSDIDAVAVTYAPGLIGAVLVGLLAAGNENCCLQEVKPVQQPASNVPPKPVDIFVDDEALKEQEAAARAAKAQREKEEKERKERERKERELREKEEKKKKKKEGPSWFEKTFNKLSNEIFSDDDMK